jgi:signal transduction histidine kinase
MKALWRKQLRGRLTLWYVAVLALILAIYIVLVFAFQYAIITHQIYHDEMQDVVTVEGLLFFDSHGALQLQQDYFSRPRSHLLIDRLMEIRDQAGTVLYRSPTLSGMALGGPPLPREGDDSSNEHVAKLADGSHVFLISHLHSMQGRTMLIRLGYSLAPFRERMTQFLGTLLIAFPITLLIAGFAGYEVVKRALMPLQQMAARAESITASNLQDRLEIQNPDDELGHMAKVFNHLLERLEQAFVQLQHFTADAAHELRTPLASLRTVAEIALRGESEQEIHREALGSILEETTKLNQTIDGLLLLTKAEIFQPQEASSLFSLIELTSEVLSVLEVIVEERQVHIVEQTHGSMRATVRGDRGLIRAAIMNIVHNALKFSPLQSTISIDYSFIDSTSPLVELSVQDQGSGINALELDKVFDRFFTSTSRETAAMSGAGIGLSIAKLVVERSGGQIFFDSAVVEGARCVIRLPATAAHPSSLLSNEDISGQR